MASFQPQDDEDSSLMHLKSFRRPSLAFLDTPIGSFKGPNSLHNFASSFTRAQSFAASKIDNQIHKKRSFFVRSDDPNNDDGAIDDETFDAELMVPSSRGERLSIVVNDLNNRNQLFGYSGYGGTPSDRYNDVFYQDDIISALNDGISRHNLTTGTSPGAATSSAPSAYGATTAGIPIHPNKRMYHAPSMSSVRSMLSMATTASHIALKKIEDKDGNVVTVLEGQSTAPQTVFNSVNILIGVGLLALPVGILKAGWVIGVPFLALSGLVTCWTAGLISKAMDTDRTIMTYADLGFASYGSFAKLIISLIFSIDLLGAGVSLVVLFSDSVYALLGDDENWTRTKFKLIGFFVLTPFTFMPLPVLSVFSLLGIASTISITLLVFLCGLLKPTSPGSLREVMPTNLWPQSWPDLLLAIGIIAAPFGGHAVFPNLKSDMRHPYKFIDTLKITYSISMLTDCLMAILGFLMFGKYCNNEVTNNVLLTSGYPGWLYPLISGLICMVPLSKTALNAKPIISTCTSILKFDKPTDRKVVAAFRSTGTFVIKIGVNAVFIALAILFPEFDRIVGMMGASICFLVCVIFPCSFYLKLCGHQIGLGEKIVVWTAMIISAILGLAGTYAVLKY